MTNLRMNTQLEEFLELSQKDIWTLNEKLKIARFNFGLDMKSETYNGFDETLRKTRLLEKLIKSKKKYEKEEYFLNNAYLFCKAIEEEELIIAEDIKSDLEYFKHCFMENTPYWTMPIRYAKLKPLLEQE